MYEARTRQLRRFRRPQLVSMADAAASLEQGEEEEEDDDDQCNAGQDAPWTVRSAQ